MLWRGTKRLFWVCIFLPRERAVVGCALITISPCARLLKTPHWKLPSSLPLNRLLLCWAPSSFCSILVTMGENNFRLYPTLASSLLLSFHSIPIFSLLVPSTLDLNASLSIGTSVQENLDYTATWNAAMLQTEVRANVRFPHPIHTHTAY